MWTGWSRCPAFSSISATVPAPASSRSSLSNAWLSRACATGASTLPKLDILSPMLGPFIVERFVARRGARVRGRRDSALGPGGGAGHDMRAFPGFAELRSLPGPPDSGWPALAAAGVGSIDPSHLELSGFGRILHARGRRPAAGFGREKTGAGSVGDEEFPNSSPRRTNWNWRPKKQSGWCRARNRA